jgi:cytosine/adenosine deaminase-related metal-dependent hydrolase
MAMNDGVSRRTMLQLAGVVGAGMAMPALGKNAETPKPEGQAHWLIRHATILSMDPRIGDIADGDVLIRNGAIVAVGRQLDADGAQVLDARGMVLMPGLIDSHWHMWNSLLRNAAPTAQGTTFFKTLAPLSARFTPALSSMGVRLSLAEAINAGITTVNNWAHNVRGPAFADAEVRALEESGVRARFWYGYPQDMAATGKMDFKDIQRLKRMLSTSSRVDLGLAIRGPERTEATLWEEEFAFAKAENLPISTHIAVTREAQKKRAVRQLAERGLLNSSVQLVHATHVDAEDLQLIAKSGATVSLTPLTEMRVGYGLAPVMALHEAKIPISLGIDTLVLSGNANPFMVMQTTLNLATAMSENELALTPKQVLHWATQGGADEMGIGSVTGSISPGKRADLMLIDTRRLGLTPFTDAAASVVQSATPADVHTVIADGRVLKQAGKLVGIDVDALMKEAVQAWGMFLPNL